MCHVIRNAKKPKSPGGTSTNPAWKDSWDGRGPSLQTDFWSVREKRKNNATGSLESGYQEVYSEQTTSFGSFDIIMDPARPLSLPFSPPHFPLFLRDGADGADKRPSEAERLEH